MAELPGVLKVVAPSLQEQALWKLDVLGGGHGSGRDPPPAALPLDGPRTGAQPSPSTPPPCLSSGGQQTRWGKSTCRAR